MRSLRFAIVWLATAWLVLATASPLFAASSPKKPSCKKIRDAVWAGRTLEQLTKEFDTDAETIMKCTQKQGRRKADPKAKKKATTKSGKSTGSSSTGKSKSSSQPSVRKPSAPRSGPWPKHMP